MMQKQQLSKHKIFFNLNLYQQAFPSLTNEMQMHNMHVFCNTFAIESPAQLPVKSTDTKSDQHLRSTLVQISQKPK